MSYNFEFNSPVIGRIQPFEYSYATTNEYAFTYDRDIYSDLSKFNAPIFVIRKRRGIFFYDKTYLAIKPNYGFRIDDITKTKQSTKFKNEFRIHEDISAIKEDSNLNIIYDNLFGHKDILVNILKELLLKQNENILNVYDTFFGEKYIPRKIAIIDMKSAKKYFSLEKFDDYYLGALNDKILNVYNIIALKSSTKEIIVNDNILLKEPINKVIVNKNVLLNKPINNLHIYNNYMASKTDVNILNVYNNYFGKTPIKEMYINNNFMMSKIDVNKLFVYNIINCTKPTVNNLSIHKQIILKKDHILKTSINDYLAIQKHNNYNLYIQKQIYRANTNNKDLQLFKKISVNLASNKAINIQYKIPTLAKYKKNLIKSKDIILGYHPNRKASFRKENLFVYKFDHDLFIRQDVLLSKENHDFRVNNTEQNLSLLRKEFNIKDYTTFLCKDRKGFVINNTESVLYKNNHEFSINTTEKELFKIRKGFVVNYTEDFIKKARKGFRIDDYAESIYRDRYSMSINITDVDLNKFELPVGIIPHNNTIGFMIPEKNLYKNNTNQVLKFSPKDVFSNNINILLNKDNKRSSIELNNIFVITEQRKCFLEYYHGVMLSKNIKSCLLDMGNQSIEKVLKDGIIYNDNIFYDKYIKHIFIKDDISLSKNTKTLFKNNENTFLDRLSKETFLSSDIYLGKILKTISTTNSIWINKKYHMINIFNEQDFVYKDIYEAYVADNNIFMDKAEYQVNINSYINTKVKEKKMVVNKDTTLTKEKYKSDINEYVFVTKQQYITNPYVSEMMHMQKIIKDLERPVEKTYNWAYVYQYDDPIDPNYDYYGIDELLLPEKDIDYSSFEETIFNKNTMTPRNPIKIIDNNTFIAKYPIKHPTPNYEEIGIVYIDVPTELMYAIFTKFYQVWYANIFKFGNMSMVDSLKLMLDYMYSYIVTTYSGSKYLEPALRVFKQIRWFGETSVMHNAQYKITCEYEDLKSNLQTGKCMIKNELSGFFVDKNLKVLSTKSTSIGQEAYIKLYASNREDSQISFSVSLTRGNIDVYINDIHVDTIYSNHASITYDLPATDTENIIMLKRPASNNYGNCYVGNIVIKNGTYKSLNIEYDPELKAGNMPLNDIVNKMVILANMYDNEGEAFEQFRKGNLAISELYKRLENYWELHHANKIKGKRLTIKET